MRNFWIECEIDGKKTKLASGPRAKDGGFELTVKVRSNGESLRAVEIRGFVHSVTGKLILDVREFEPVGNIHNAYVTSTRVKRSNESEYTR